MVHGGPWDRWADELMASWVSWGQWLAAAGFAVFCPNPRGGQGHGLVFAAMLDGAVGQGEWTDILAGLDTLVADGVADPARLGIAGWSHGGFMAAWAVTQTGRFRAAVMGGGITDWSMQVSVGELGRTDAGLTAASAGKDPARTATTRSARSPTRQKVTAPVLILHGENDTNVPVGQAMYFHRALTQSGTEHELVIYPREDHCFTERAHQIDVLERTRAWFTRWLRGPDDR
jgi:dipeptidyl aminopeptidase/acylaminoacyl peptidase